MGDKGGRSGGRERRAQSSAGFLGIVWTVCLSRHSCTAGAGDSNSRSPLAKGAKKEDRGRTQKVRAKVFQNFSQKSSCKQDRQYKRGELAGSQRDVRTG